MNTKKFDVERFDVNESYENKFLNLIKEEHLYRYENARDFLKKKHATPFGVIDAACGNGYGFQYLGGFGNYLGIDISDVALQRAKNNHPTASYRQGNLAFDSDFDGIDPVKAIVSFETIEHLPDPDRFCANCFLKLKETNGYFIVSAPTILTRDFDPYHLHDRTANGWRQSVVKSGFSILEEKSLGFEIDFQTFATSTPNNPEQEKIIAKFLLTHPRYLVARIWEWGIKRKFTWKNQIYFCQAQ